MSNLFQKAVALAACVFLIHVDLLPGQSTKLALTVDNIMCGPGLVGYEPGEVRWSGDTERVYFRWKQAADPA